jgi:nucleoside-diphosphate-sugar epimerase
LNIFLTGATGFVGSHILSKLLHCGHNVTIIKRPNSDTKRIDDYIDQVRIIDNENNINSTLEFDCIVHAATSYENSDYAGSDILSANINLPVYLLDYAVNNKCKKFINISTFIAKYETSPPNRYALTKRHVEEWGMYYCDHYPLNFVNVVLHQVYGTGDSITKFTPWLVNELKTNGKSIELTEGNQERDFINILDVVEAISLIVNHNSGSGYDEYEVCTGNVITIKNFIETVKKITNSTTILNFGSMPYRENEIMTINPDPSKMHNLGWNAKLKLEFGIKMMVAE